MGTCLTSLRSSESTGTSRWFGLCRRLGCTCESCLHCWNTRIQPFGLSANLSKGNWPAIVSSISMLKSVEKNRLVVPLSEKEVYTIVRSWKTVKEDMTKTGMIMFLRMFETSAAVKSAFEKFRTMDTPTELWQSTVLETHGMVVMSAIDEVISNLDDEECVIELVLEQGRSHARFGDLSEDMFWAIEQPFLAAVKETMGERYRSHIDALYQKTIKWILTLLALGFRLENEERRRSAHHPLQAALALDKRGSRISTTGLSLIGQPRYDDPT